MSPNVIDAYINGAGNLAFTGMSAIFGNDQVKEIADKVATFVNYNWEFIFASVTVLSFVFNPLSFLTGLVIGLWVYDKEFTMNPGSQKFSPSDLFSNPKNELTCLTVSITSRFVLGGCISSLSVGFLSGCYVRKLCTAAVSVPL